MYNYSLVETNGAGRVVIAGNITDAELFVERNVTVSPFTNHTATVVAFTNVGSGDSVMEIALSPEAGKLILCVFVCIPSILYLVCMCEGVSLTLRFYSQPLVQCRI